jgi:polyhydroxyalkanoate synthase subunit PhaC
MLTDAAIDPPGAGRLVQPAAAVKLAAGLARHPRRVSRGVGNLAVELARVAVGSSQVAPPKGDRRFSDRGWQESWRARSKPARILAFWQAHTLRRQ